jgi:UDPglucose 6-dehydrogenase
VIVEDKKCISVVGLGVVGLTTALGFKLRGHDVIGIDIQEEKVEMINNGICPIYEPGLAEALRKVRIEATTDHAAALKSSITFMCGGTPPREDGSIDLYFLEQPAKQLFEVLKNKKEHHLVVVRSTVVPSTTEKVIMPMTNGNGNIGICVNPEFLKEGTAMEDFMEPSRVVIGENNKKDGDVLEELYRDFNCPIMRTNLRTAEMIKSASNAYLATRISFINELGNSCRLAGIDIYEVAKGMGYDHRIGGDYLRAGLGFGGFCLPKDLSALISHTKELGYEPRLLEAVQQINMEQPSKMIELLKMHFPSLKGKTIGILGLSFKPGTCDVRKSKAIEIIKALTEEGAKVKAYDPRAMSNFQKVYPNTIKYSTAEEVTDTDAVLILTEWDEFNELDYKDTIVIDGRRVLKAKEATKYEGLCW